MIRWLFVISVALSAFLLFLVQPLMGRFVLPWFGGSHVVWTTCLLFFQATLLAGYAYAHLVTSKLGVRGVWLHLPLLGLCLLFLPLIPSDSLRPLGESSPVWGVLLVLLAVVGLPYFALSTTGPLLQVWYARLFPQRNPYRLFALSNLGSLVGLFAYPFVVEPWLSRSAQAWTWSVGFVLFAIGCGTCAWRVARGWESDAQARLDSSKEPVDDELAKLIAERAAKKAKALATGSDLPLRWRWPLWIGLSFLASLLLVATTSHISQEVAVVPFLWTVPLGLYLLSFVLSFDRPGWYVRGLWLVVAGGTLIAAEFAVWMTLVMPIDLQITLLCGALFSACMVSHGELARLKPETEHLTAFYLCISLGGVLGGFSCAVLAPLLLADYWELGIGYLLFPVIVALVLVSGRSKRWALATWIAGPLLIPLWAVVLWTQMSGHSSQLVSTTLKTGFVAAVKEVVPQLHQWREPDVVFQSRDEYGVLTVFARPEGRYLFNGRIMHGMQVNSDEALQPTSYYGPTSGMGISIESLRQKVQDRGLRIGIVGLGTGVGAAYARPADTVVFYELHPKVEVVARKYFDFLKQCEGTVQVRLGDARMTMERELAMGEPQRFDLIAVDAFSSDAIPQHLLTREAFEIYKSHLAEGGILAIHVSNRFLQLGPVVRNIASEMQQESLRVYDKQPADRFQQVSDWVLVTGARESLPLEQLSGQIIDWSDDPRVEVVWTDNYGSLWQVLRPTKKN